MRPTSPRLLRLVLNWWSPFRGAGIRVRHIGPDFRSATVEMRLRSSNRSPSGTQAGGSLYAMTDPFFALMLQANLGGDYLVWDKAGSIDHVAPARDRVWARLELGAAELDSIVRMTASGDKHLHLFKVDIKDDDGMVVARVEKMVYVRRKRDGGQEP
jgi:acyl-coenzyme A thioesterase PaaI-like protein